MLSEQHVRQSHVARGKLHPSVPDQVDAMFECPEEGCELKFHYFLGNSFATRPFLHHLLNDHVIKNKADRDAGDPSWKGNPCFFPDCNDKTLYAASKQGREAYDIHLATTHNAKDKVERFKYSWARIRGRVLPLRPNVAAAKAKAEGTQARPVVLDSGKE